MKNIRKILRPAAALLLSLAAAGAMAGSQSVSVSIIGPGGHSNGDYGNVNAVHAAARSIMLIEKSVPDAVVTAVTGGNSVNSIAAYANFRVLLEGQDRRSPRRSRRRHPMDDQVIPQLASPQPLPEPFTRPRQGHLVFRHPKPVHKR